MPPQLIETFLVLLLAAFAGGDPVPVKGVRRDAPFHAYWATPREQERSKYQLLLVTHGPVENLAGHTAWSKLPLDNMAMTFETYGRDSFWSRPCTPVQKFGAVDAKTRSMEMDGVTYEYEPCSIEQVIKLLKNPLGTLPISRIEHPLTDAKLTCKALRLLLEDQVRAEEADKP